MRPNSFSVIKRPGRIRISRRDLLRGFGALGVLGRLPAEVLRPAVWTPAPGTRATAQTCIFINLLGAPSHVDTFDYKAGNAPANHKIVTSNGITINSTIFPNLSAITGDLCVIRSMQSVEEAHPRGQWAVHTAHSSNPAVDAETPHIGAVVASELPAGKFPAFLALNGNPGQGSAFLSGAYGPTTTQTSCGFPYFQHDFYGGASQQRFDQKYALLKALDPSRASAPDPAYANFDAFYETARGMMYDPAIGNVFSCADADVARYGNTEIGKALLVARQAVQARNGARFIHVLHQNWDTHAQMYTRGYRLAGTLANLWDLAVELDRGLGALVADLKASGDLARTLIVVMGEFGRTPGPLNGQGGRDHLKTAMCGVLIGGGVAGGRVIGSTDAIGRVTANPGWSQNRGIYIQDITATIYSALGIDWTKTLPTPSGGTFQYCPIISNGANSVPTPVNEVFA